MSKKEYVVVAIDGMSGSGKSSIAKGIAKHFGFTYLDTGSLYRAVTLVALRNNFDPQKMNDDDFSSYSKLIDVLKQTKLEFHYDEKTNSAGVTLNNENVTPLLKTPEISNVVASFSKLPKVREWVKDFQVSYADNHNIVMEGRDITTVIFPDAKYKIFVKIDEDVRAERRYADYQKLGKNETLEKIKEEFKKREEMDTHRKTSPLTIAKDAYVLDNSFNTFEESLNDAIAYINSKK